MKMTRHPLSLALVVGALAGSTGCERTPEPGGANEPATEQDRGAVDDRARVDPEVDPGQELQQAGAELDQSKDEAVAVLRQRPRELDREIEQLDERARERGQELRADLKTQRGELQSDLDRLEERSEEGWDEAKQGFANALGRLERELAQARQEIDPEPARDDDLERTQRQ